MSKDDSGLHRRPKNTEFHQVIPPGVAPNVRRRNSMPPPLERGGRVLPMIRPYQPPVGGGQSYWYHVTTPGNFERVLQSGGLLPSNLQPQRSAGLDLTTGRAQPSWGTQLRQASGDVRLAQQFAPLLGNQLVTQRRAELMQLGREGANQENLYMSSRIGSTQDYLASQPFMEDGARIMRVPRQGTRGFAPDTQGKNADFRSLGRVISSRHLEFAELSPEQVRNLYDKSEQEFSRHLRWQPMVPKKTQPVRFSWAPGSCSSEERKRHGGGGRDMDPDGSAGVAAAW